MQHLKVIEAKSHYQANSAKAFLLLAYTSTEKITWAFLRQVMDLSGLVIGSRLGIHGHCPSTPSFV